MTAVRIKRMYQRNVHGDYAAITATFVGRDNKGKEILRKTITGKVGTDVDAGDFTFDIGGKAASEVAVQYDRNANTTLEWKIDR